MSHKVIWRGDRAMMEIAEAYFSEIADPPADAVWLANLKPETEASQEWAAEVYFSAAPDIPALETALSAYNAQWRPADKAVLEVIPDKDWVAHSLEGLGVVQAGRFVLYGVHDTDKLNPDDGAVTIRIDANQAFGTGHHPTTAGCLALLDRLAGFAPKSILDLGCGSAVLAIAAAKLWDRSILASDIDEASVAIAAENATLNGVGGQVRTLTADGFDHDAISERAPFDFIFANILAGPLKELAPDMARHTQKNGRVMLAGLMAEQEDGVIAAYETHGFRLLNRLDHETWPVLLFVREGD